MDDIARGLELSEAYRQMTKLGTLPKVRQNNDRIMCEYFDKKMGLVHEEDKPGLFGKWMAYGFVPAACVAVGWYVYS